MEQLTDQEKDQAREIAIWRVVQVAPSPLAPKDPVTRTVSYHLTRASAIEDQERRGGPPGLETAGFDVRGADLLVAWEHGTFSAAEVRVQIDREFGPLTDDESVRAARTRVWTVWYEDRFHFGPDRDLPVAVAHHVTREDAERDAEARGGQGELAGYDVGQSTLLEGLRARTVRRTGLARVLLVQARPIEEAMFERVKAFLAREVAGAAKRELTPETRLVEDLGLAGREGARVMAGFFRELSVDPEGFEVTRYFAADVIGVFGKATRPMETGRPQTEITIDELLTAAMLGRWDVELP